MNYSILLALFIHTPAQAMPPNFVFMFSDDQRYDALSVVQKKQGAKEGSPGFKLRGWIVLPTKVYVLETLLW